MALPILNIMLVSLASLIIGLPLIYVLSRALKLRPTPMTIAKPLLDESPCKTLRDLHETRIAHAEEG